MCEMLSEMPDVNQNSHVSFKRETVSLSRIGNTQPVLLLA